MQIKVFKNRSFDILSEFLLPMLVLLVLSITIVFGVKQTEASSRAEGRRLLEESITYAVVRNYAIEGYYPPSIGFIEEQYGIYIDRSRYAVFYVIYGSNMIPQITVVEM